MVVEDHQELVHMGLYLGHVDSRYELPPLLSGQLLLQVLYLLKKNKKYFGQVTQFLHKISLFIRTNSDYWNDFIVVWFICMHLLLLKIAWH